MSYTSTGISSLENAKEILLKAKRLYTADPGNDLRRKNNVDYIEHLKNIDKLQKYCENATDATLWHLVRIILREYVNWYYLAKMLYTENEHQALIPYIRSMYEYKEQLENQGDSGFEKFKETVKNREQNIFMVIYLISGTMVSDPFIESLELFW